MKTTSFGQVLAEEPTDHKTVKMSIDNAGMEHLMSNLTNLYSNPVAAVLREYSANAVDSHVKAQQGKPVLVTLPTKAKPVFVVQDFGVGLSEDDLENIYSKYGSSTKQDSNSQIGAFGLGAKSALAISNRFDIVAIKDGERNEVYVEKNSRGVGVFHFLKNSKTAEPNGVTISIPAESLVSDFAEAAENFFVAWKPGTVVVDGVTPETIYDKEYVVIKSAGQDSAWVKIKTDNKSPQPYHLVERGVESINFVVGGIVYHTGVIPAAQVDLCRLGKLNGLVTSLIQSGNRVYLNLPIGSVDLTPSRDALLMNDKTFKAIRATVNDFLASAMPSFTSHLQSLERREALSFVAFNPSFFTPPVIQSRYNTPSFFDTKQSISWRGEKLPALVSINKDKCYYAVQSRERASVDEGKRIAEIAILKAAAKVGHTSRHYSTGEVIPIIVYSKGGETESEWATVRKNLRDYALATYNTESAYVVYTDDKTRNMWVTAAYNTVDLDDLVSVAREQRRVKRASASTGAPRGTASYIIFDTALSSHTLQKVGVKDLEYRDITYLEWDNSPYTSFNPWNVIRSVSLGSTWDSTLAKISIVVGDRLKALFPNQCVVFLTSGKKGETLQKRYPNAVSMQERLSKELEDVLKNPAQRELFVGVKSERGAFSRECNPFVVISERGLLTSIQSSYTISLIEEITEDGYINKLVNFVEDLKPVMAENPSYQALNEIGEKLDHRNLQNKYLLISNTNFHLKLAPNRITVGYLNQLVSFINLMDAQYENPVAP